MFDSRFCYIACLAIVSSLLQRSALANDAFDAVAAPILQEHCVKCHGRDEVHGEVNLQEQLRTAGFRSDLQLIETLITVVADRQMPPEGEPALDSRKRAALLVQLQGLLRESIARRASVRTPIRRMNRFQYNNAVQDLFKLKVVVFSLPERMMREHDNYFQPQSRSMPATLKVGSRPLGKSQLIEPRLAGVTSFPQDLRAEHGFDNRADHLTLSPMLLESFLQLGQSIINSPDFNEQTCGIWPELFSPPEQDHLDLDEIIRARLKSFLTRAFRRPVERELLNRYCQHVQDHTQSGTSFTEAMKSAAAAALASPKFFYLYDHQPEPDAEGASQLSNSFNLASRLSFFLWASIPDQELLDLAQRGRLRDPTVLAAQADRMLGDKRLKRFCDSFPSQWLQLERIVSSTPDPQKYPQFYFAKYRASMHMMLEPLLLFETVLIENRSLLQFIDSDFSYRSKLLESWYRDGSQGAAGSPVQVSFQRVPIKDRRQGGLITNAAVMTMTSNAKRTQPITRGAWMAGVILNDPPDPPPANVPPLAEQPTTDEKEMSLRERFAAHRQRPACAGCHRKLDPLGFALENYDAAGIWRDVYDNGQAVDASGSLFGKYHFSDIVELKDVLLAEPDRFTRAFAAHLLAFALGRQVKAEDAVVLDRIVQATADADYRFQSLIRQIVLSEAFRY